MPVVEVAPNVARERNDPAVIGAGIIGGFIAGGFTGSFGVSAAIDFATVPSAFNGMALIVVALAVGWLGKLARFGWFFAAVGALLAVWGVPAIYTTAMLDLPTALTALASSIGLIYGGALLSLRAGTNIQRCLLLLGFAVGYLTDGRVFDDLFDFDRVDRAVIGGAFGLVFIVVSLIVAVRSSSTVDTKIDPQSSTWSWSACAPS